MPPAFDRKNSRLPLMSYLGRSFCFATLCFEQRASYACDPKLARWLAIALHEIASQKSLLVHAYCVMPDHLHFLVEGTSPTADILSFVRAFKQKTGYLFSQRKRQRLWQSVATENPSKACAGTSG